jgi:hypothetical protein
MPPRENRILASLLLVGLVGRLAIAWAPFEWLLRHVICDDAFYYFTIARNVVQGHGFTFDRLAETNGFHPLWMVLILPLYALIDDRVAAIHGVLTVSALIDTCSILLLYRLLRALRLGRSATFAACMLYAVAPILLSPSGPMNGMETAANTALILLYLTSARNILEGTSPKAGAIVAFGIISGMLFLVRTDNIILLASISVGLALSRRQSARPVMMAGLLGVLVAAPWASWSLLRFGSVIQVSGLSTAHMMRATLEAQGWTWTAYAAQFLRNAGNTITFFPVFLHGAESTSLIPVLIASCLAALGTASLVRFRRLPSAEKERLRQAWRFLLLSIMAVGLFILVHTVRNTFMRGWYYMSTIPILLIALASVLDPIFQTTVPRMPAAKLILAVIVLAVLGYISVPDSRYGEVDKYRLVRMMNERLPEGARVGSWNAGLFGYFFERGTVVGLDGLVNNNAYEHIRNRTLGAYCRENDIRYIADPVSPLRTSNQFWDGGRKPIASTLQILFGLYGRKERDSLVVGMLMD